MRKARYWRDHDNNIQPALPRQQCVPIDDDGLEAPVKFARSVTSPVKSAATPAFSRSRASENRRFLFGVDFVWLCCGREALVLRLFQR
jgi:hypothetical protein